MFLNSNKWDLRFIRLAKEVSTWSKDPSTQVGAIIVQPDSHLVVGIGYNGFPRGVNDSDERLTNRLLKYKFVVHAEINAILMAGEKVTGASLYIYPAFNMPPICNECCKVAIQSGIKEIIGSTTNIDEDRASRWNESLQISKIMCEEAGIKWRNIIDN